MDRTILTANLKPLDRRGLVETAPDPTDRRARPLRLTPGRAAQPRRCRSGGISMRRPKRRCPIRLICAPN
uniref:MarR family winged helix-turn-helix transcriptional regulator n=1 Tax=Chelativorans sp. YIM 93263 TaxID=2906648 RepID=UPI002377EE58|nr:MarR family winged helix-turn-helix transcriptional regulator [Chelativorans sp. YIM 93263]